MMSAPSSASRSAWDRSCPRAAPVIRVTLPSNCSLLFVSLHRFATASCRWQGTVANRCGDVSCAGVLLMLLASAEFAVFIGALIGDVRQRREVQPTRHERARGIPVGRNLDEHRGLRVKS